MGAEGLEQAAEKLGHEIRVEIQGAMGAEDELTSQEIADADAVIIAADTSVNRDRFEGKPLVKAKVAKAINEAEELIREAVEKADGEADHDESAVSTEADDETESKPAETDETPTETASDPSDRGRSESGGLLSKLKSLFS
jgi:PTS system fructose-specific IIB component